MFCYSVFTITADDRKLHEVLYCHHVPIFQTLESAYKEAERVVTEHLRLKYPEFDDPMSMSECVSNKMMKFSNVSETLNKGTSHVSLFYDDHTNIFLFKHSLHD